MTRRNICDIDQRVTQGRIVPARKAIKLVADYIIDNLDPTFPRQDFVNWADSASEKPFRWNKVIYYWS
jgi:hypothetical protein